MNKVNLNDYYLCNRIKYFRLKLGFSQKELGDLIGVSRNTIIYF